ncbi:hypothetical protein [Bathymodiolus japonicus methanotrophic gill symbiont]|uniref:hypothetical protein n=1 Tax=Bathymodiolus japonicus methanotrophic gill symbiont TaxID=113269 RepID=UPI001C8D17CD|nr:hypothetical protein [Bathymodiolus japonicus methanotrophic gill symbiont]
MNHKKEFLDRLPFERTDPSAQTVLQSKKQHKVKLWQLDHIYHCAIIGTCLTLDEVKKLLRQLHIGTNGFLAYELHTTIVTLISENNHPSKKVQSYLDKKFKSAVQETKIFQQDQLKGYWKAALYSGDMIGAFWAVLSHPASNKEMKRVFYGDIHMLSHLSGASNRADIQRLSLLEQERTNHKTELHSWKVKHNKLATKNRCLSNTINTHIEQQSDLENQVHALRNSLDQLQILQNVKERQELDALVEKLMHKNNYQKSEIVNYQNQEQNLSTIVANQKQQILDKNDQLLTYQNEVEYLQSTLREKSQPQCPLQKQNLCGKCILYVGGKTNLIPHYRELVEESSGNFIHHDGGLEKTAFAKQGRCGCISE